MKNAFHIMLILLLTTLAGKAESIKTLTFNAGVAFPIKDFGETGNSFERGYAKLGSCGGIDFCLGLNNHFQFLITGYIIRNDYHPPYFGELDNSSSKNFNYYYNYPFLAGVKYQKQVKEGITLAIFGQAGMNTMKGPNVWAWDYNNLSVKTEMEEQAEICYSLAVEIKPSFPFSLTLRYFYLGLPSFKQTIHNRELSKTEIMEWNLPIKVYSLSVGYILDFDE